MIKRLNTRILAVGALVVLQLAVLTSVLDARLPGHAGGWAMPAEVLCFVAAAALGLTARSRKRAGS